MRTPKARKLPSGSWFCRVRVDGKDVPITKPTEAEAIAEAVAVKLGLTDAAQAAKHEAHDITLEQAISNYISARQNVASPSTIRGYRIVQKYRFQKASNRRLADITDQQWQQIVNAESRVCSAKTVKNAWGLVSSVITETTGRKVKVRLPQTVEKDRPFLDPDQITIFVKAIRGSEIEIPALLGLSSLRKSEILALDWKHIDLAKGVIRVEGAAVLDEHNNLVFKKTNKNKKSRRKIPIIHPLKEALENQPVKSGLIVKTYHNDLYKQINKVCREWGLPEVGVHGLRRSFASLAYHLGFSEEMTMKIGGWSDIYTMRRIYTKLAERDIAEKSSVFTSFFQQDSVGLATPNGNESENSTVSL